MDNSQSQQVKTRYAPACSDTDNGQSVNRTLTPNIGEYSKSTDTVAEENVAPMSLEGNGPATSEPGTGPRIIPNLPGYAIQQQHPFYLTSSRDIGLRPATCNLPVRYFPRDNSFTLSVQGIGNYMDSHFTTALDCCKHTQL